VFARQLCRRIPRDPGLRPVALRPTLSGGLPLSGRESLRSFLRLMIARGLPSTTALKWSKTMSAAIALGHF